MDTTSHMVAPITATHLAITRLHTDPSVFGVAAVAVTIVGVAVTTGAEAVILTAAATGMLVGMAAVVAMVAEATVAAVTVTKGRSARWSTVS